MARAFVDGLARTAVPARRAARPRRLSLFGLAFESCEFEQVTVNTLFAGMKVTLVERNSTVVDAS
jgi:hypothetical protein